MLTSNITPHSTSKDKGAKPAERWARPIWEYDLVKEVGLEAGTITHSTASPALALSGDCPEETPHLLVASCC